MKWGKIHGKHGRGNKHVRFVLKCATVMTMIFSMVISSTSITVVPHAYANGTYEPEVDIFAQQPKKMVTLIEEIQKVMEVGSIMANAARQVKIPEPVKYFNVPLSEDLQDHIFAECEKRGVDPAIIMAMIDRESDFRPSCIGDNGNSLGLMQIQPRWHQDRANNLGCPDLMNPYHNVTVGIDLFADLLAYDISVEWALMAYNGGPSYANKKLARGEISDYAWAVMRNAEVLEKGRI